MARGDGDGDGVLICGHGEDAVTMHGDGEDVATASGTTTGHGDGNGIWGCGESEHHGRCIRRHQECGKPRRCADGKHHVEDAIFEDSETDDMGLWKVPSEAYSGSVQGISHI